MYIIRTDKVAADSPGGSCCCFPNNSLQCYRDVFAKGLLRTVHSSILVDRFVNTMLPMINQLAHCFLVVSVSTLNISIIIGKIMIVVSIV